MFSKSAPAWSLGPGRPGSPDAPAASLQKVFTCDDRGGMVDRMTRKPRAAHYIVDQLRCTALAAGCVLAIGALLTPVAAEPPSKAPPGKSEATPWGARPEADGNQNKAEKPAKGAVDEAAAKDAIRKLSESQPTTAEEKERLLANLYAHLATADNEDASTRVANAIERLWRFSGSDSVQLLMERAAKALADKQNDLALDFLDAVVELAPDYPEGWNRRAYVYFTNNAYDRALGDIRRTLALDPNHFKALEGLGQIMKELGRKPAAHRAFQQLLAVHPFAAGARQVADELARDVDGQGI